MARGSWAQFTARSTLAGLGGTGVVWGVAMPPGLSLGPPTRPEVRRRVQAHGTGLCGVSPPHRRRRRRRMEGGTATSGSNGGNLGVGCAWTLIRSVPRGWAITSR